MVFFTCNKCGESLKKKDVEKHCNTRCRGPPFLTCVDCLKDFREDFVKHTACVTEDDRYSAMGLKGLQTKQKSKQQLWVETVQNCVSRAIDDGVPGITPSIRSLLLYLQEQPSLPDKPKPFANFVKNARRSEPPQNIEFVWKILEEARNDLQAKQKAEREAAEAERKKAKEQQKQNKVESSESSSDDSDNSDSENDKAQKNGAVSNDSKSGNSSKHNAPNEDIVNGGKDKKKKRMISESSEAMANATGLQKVKKKKRNPESESQDNENTANLKDAMDACHLNTQTSSSEDQKLTKKERKEKKKRGKYEAELKEIESTEVGDGTGCMEIQEEAPDADTDGKKSKKKKNKKQNAEDTNAEGETESQLKEERKKDKKNKKKGKHDDNDEIGESSNTGKKNGRKTRKWQLNETLNLDEQEKTKFSWDTVILQVLESQSDNEISFKRLSKKVINEYLNSLGDDAHFDEARIMNKFQKRLDKMHNVVFYKDKVKLKTSRD